MATILKRQCSSREILLFFGLFVFTFCFGTNDAAFQSHYTFRSLITRRSTTSHRGTVVGSSSSKDDDNNHLHEKDFEKMSKDGADAIASLSLDERTQRAMMAEAIEDRIFAISDELDSMIGANGMIAENLRQDAVHLARESSTLKKQYSDLVSGKPSGVLSSISSMFSEKNSTKYD